MTQCAELGPKCPIVIVTTSRSHHDIRHLEVTMTVYRGCNGYYVFYNRTRVRVSRVDSGRQTYFRLMLKGDQPWAGAILRKEDYDAY